MTLANIIVLASVIIALMFCTATAYEINKRLALIAQGIGLFTFIVMGYTLI